MITITMENSRIKYNELQRFLIFVFQKLCKLILNLNNELLKKLYICFCSDVDVGAGKGSTPHDLHIYFLFSYIYIYIDI